MTGAGGASREDGLLSKRLRTMSADRCLELNIVLAARWELIAEGMINCTGPDSRMRCSNVLLSKGACKTNGAPLNNAATGPQTRPAKLAGTIVETMGAPALILVRAIKSSPAAIRWVVMAKREKPF